MFEAIVFDLMGFDLCRFFHMSRCLSLLIPTNKVVSFVIRTACVL